MDTTAVLDVLQKQGRMAKSDLAKAVGEEVSKINFPLARLQDGGEIVVAGDEVILNLSAQERREFQRLEKKFEKGVRDATAALREIRERKLYREEYASFDDYMAIRWQRTRQWATQQINWLRRMDLLEERGKDSYQLTVDDAQVLGPLEEHPEEFLRAVEEAEAEAKNSSKKRNKKMLQEAVDRQLAYIHERGQDGIPDDLTYDEYHNLAALAAKRLFKPNLVDEAQRKAAEGGRSLEESLIEVCTDHHHFPCNSDLLEIARGDALRRLLAPLAAMQKQWSEVAELEEEKQALERKMEEIETKLKPERKDGSELASTNETTHPDQRDKGDDENQACENSDDEGQESLYDVELSGDFEAWASECLSLTQGKSVFTGEDLREILSCIARTLEETGECITSESLIKVKPHGQLSAQPQ